ncbi:MAG: hypothetical protein ACREBO_03925 [Novosphingobium sp.]
MATQPQPQAAPQLTGPQHYLPPSPRELRSQTVQRLQAGLFGLAAMLLLVGLANIIMDRARLAETDVAPASAPETSASGASDPLADIGVVPAADPAATASGGASGAPRN